MYSYDIIQYNMNNPEITIEDKYKDPYKHAMFTSERRNGILRTSNTNKISTTCEVCYTSQGMYSCRLCNKLLCIRDVCKKKNNSYCLECYETPHNSSFIKAFDNRNPHTGCCGFFYNIWFCMFKKKRKSITPVDNNIVPTTPC